MRRRLPQDHNVIITSKADRAVAGTKVKRLTRRKVEFEIPDVQKKGYVILNDFRPEYVPVIDISVVDSMGNKLT
jgi:cysteine sulfinate desulfinase/cysteine desulfurase-like protein